MGSVGPVDVLRGGHMVLARSDRMVDAVAVGAAWRDGGPTFDVVALLSRGRCRRSPLLGLGRMNRVGCLL